MILFFFRYQCFVAEQQNLFAKHCKSCEITQAISGKWVDIMVDETTDCKTEQMLFCLCYMDDDYMFMSR